MSDEMVLEILHLVEGEGLTRRAAGARVGVSTNSVAGIVHRVRTAERDLGWEDEARKPENRDGGMPPRWWKERAEVSE
jgi:transposase